jgi:hypothetical protein
MDEQKDRINALDDPLGAAMVDRIAQASPEWQTLDAAAANQLQWQALINLVATDIIQIRVIAEVRCKWTLCLVQTMFSASGEGIYSAIDLHMKSRAAEIPEYVRDTGMFKPGEIRKHIVATRLSAAGVFIYVQDPAVDALAELLDGLRPKPPSLQIENERLWVPSEIQRDIWNALEGRSMTTDELQESVSVARATLFQKPHGINEMVELGFLKNDRSHGGYYRLDAPPQN